MTAHLFGLPSDYTENPEPQFFPDNYPGIVSQPDVYWLAGWYAQTMNAASIVDVGCGHADKLHHLSVYLPRWYAGIDLPETIDWCVRTYAAGQNPWGQWLAHDLETGLPEWDDGWQRAVVVVADVIEHLRDPRLMLQDLAIWREVGDVRAVLISTPDRFETHGKASPGYKGPPPNPAHVREWTGAELERFLTGEGLTVRHRGLTRSDDATGGFGTILVECG